MKKTTLTGILVASSVALGAGMAVAQDEDLTAEEYLAYLQSLTREAAAQGSPASTIGIPGGFALPNNAGFAAVAVSNQREQGNNQDHADGGMVFGFGLGDAQNALGVEVLLNITSVSPSDFGDSGTIDLKASRILSQTSAVSLGVGNIVKWGDSDGLDPTYSVAYSQNFLLANRNAVASLGYSTATGTGSNQEGAFAGIGVSVAPNVSVGLSLAGDEIRGGATYFTRLFDHDAQFTLSYEDIGRRNSDGRFTLSVAILDPEVFPMNGGN